MHPCKVALFALCPFLWLLPIHTRQPALSQQMKVEEQSNGMFIVRHGSFEESKTQGVDLSKSEDVNFDNFGQWSPWSKCRKRCKQVRIRACNATSCGTTILKEERKCTGDRCSIPIRRTKKHQTKHQQRFGRRRSFRVLYDLQRIIYSPWSDWGDCMPRTCHTSRYRYCMNRKICKHRKLREDAHCYTPGSECERQLKPKTFPSDLASFVEVPDNQLPSLSATSQPAAQIDDNKCGYISRPDTLASMLRIIGGEKARHRWPWMVAILNENHHHFCGGTLISPQFVVTAAHCVKKNLRVLAGEHNFAIPEQTEQNVAVSAYIIHPEYDNNTVDNDIALLKLETPLEINENVSPICLPSSDDQMAIDESGTILGWGKKRKNKTTGTRLLQEARVPIVDIGICRNTYSKYQITENMFCAGYKEGRIDSCAGDSGGPLMMRKKDSERRIKWYLYGITSFGEGCGKKEKYGIYAKVPKMVDWIRRTVSN